VNNILDNDLAVVAIALWVMVITIVLSFVIVPLAAS
jgi:hypothetical protein